MAFFFDGACDGIEPASTIRPPPRIHLLQKLGLDYIDLFLLHAPGSLDTRAETWAVLESYHRQVWGVQDKLRAG